MPVAPEDLRRTLVARHRAERAQAETRRGALVAAAQDVARTLVASRLVDAAWLIGSTVWGGFGPRSDVDVVVRGLDPVRRAGVERAFADRCDAAVDLLRWEELPADFRDRVEREGARVA